MGSKIIAEPDDNDLKTNGCVHVLEITKNAYYFIYAKDLITNLGVS